METTDWFEQFERETPEPKLELIDGRLVIGNSLAGSRYILHDLLTGWGTEAAIALAAPALWRTALHQAFAGSTPPDPGAPLSAWQSWAETVRFELHLDPAGPRSTGPHHGARERLNMGFYRACGLGGFGTSLGRDFVMRLGDNGFTADGFLIGRQATERLCQRYLNGPADLVCEVLLPGWEEQDRVVKRDFYAAGGVPDYWIVDPEARTIDFLRLTGGIYRAQALGADGRYRPASVPGLAFLPARLWQEDLPWNASVFEVESALPAGWSYQAQEGIDWDEVSFVPNPALEPRVLSFEEFASWCPRAKFEGDGVRTIIEGQRGTRNVLGMLLRTFGLSEAVKLVHPRAWVAGLAQAERWQRDDAERKARWWGLARQAAARLREKHGVQRIAVIGSLTRPEPLHFWSELALVVWELPGGTFANYDLLRDLDEERVLDLIDPEHATPAEQRAIREEAVAVGSC
jgi:predicted nucleotidyltransferase